MPHKHKRSGVAAASQHELPPSEQAKSLPANTAMDTKKHLIRGGKKQRKRSSLDNDTPKAFARLMQFKASGKRPSGLDNGDQPRGNKRKRGEETVSHATSSEVSGRKSLTLLPGEKFSDFSARVDHALPIAGLSRRGKRVEGVKERQTKTEKRLQKMHAAWRQEEARLREKEEEERELAEEEQDDEETVLKDGNLPSLHQGKKRGKRKRLIGELDDKEEDPWEVLKSKRDEPRGLHDVVQAPPEFKTVPKEKFKIKNRARIDVSNVPASAGSLRQREELGETRKEIIERYRSMMEDKRSSLHTQVSGA